MEKLILIGNKPVTKDMSYIDNEFDYVLRVNRMLNLGNTGNRIDGVFLGAYYDFVNKFNGGPHRDKYKSIKDIYMTPEIKGSFYHYPLYITQEQWDNTKIYDFSIAKKNIGCNATSTVCMLYSLLHDDNIKSKYDIYLTGLDIEGRGKMMEEGLQWKYTGHKLVGDIEEQYIKKCINDKLIKFIE